MCTSYIIIIFTYYVLREQLYQDIENYKRFKH